MTYLVNDPSTFMEDALAGFLELCDDVKFGQAPATEAEQTGLLDTAEKVLRQTASAPNAAA